MTEPSGVTTFEVVHRTTYHYDEPVSQSYGRIHLTPRDLEHQQRRDHRVEIFPRPDVVDEHADLYGNASAYFEVSTPHHILEVTATSLVEVLGRPAPPADGGPTCEEVAALLHSGTSVDVLAARPFAIGSPLAPVAASTRQYGEASLRPGRPVVDAVVDLMGRVAADFVYAPGATSVTTTLDEVLAVRRGVCQDFAHLVISACRSAGLAARYVSGYLETDPPPGRPRLRGVDASHAWASVFVPGFGWLDVDPTNDQLVDERYVVTGWGRDYADVAPLKGVIFSEGGDSSMAVSVDLRRVEPELPA